MWEAVLSIPEMKLWFEIRRNLLISSVDRNASVDQWILDRGCFLKWGWTRALVWMTLKSSPRKREINTVCEDWTKELNLKDFDEELHWWVSRVCKDWHMIHGFPGCASIGIWFSCKIGKKDSALEMRFLTELHSARNSMRSKGDNIAQVDYVPPQSMDNCFGFDLGHGCKLM